MEISPRFVIVCEFLACAGSKINALFKHFVDVMVNH